MPTYYLLTSFVVRVVGGCGGFLVGRFVLDKDGSAQKIIFSAYRRLISIRTHQKAFNPFGYFKFIDVHPSAFVIYQKSLDEKESIYALHNFSHDTISFSLNEITETFSDLLSDLEVSPNEKITMTAYQVMWLKYKI